MKLFFFFVAGLFSIAGILYVVADESAKFNLSENTLATLRLIMTVCGTVGGSALCVGFLYAALFVIP